MWNKKKKNETASLKFSEAPRQDMLNVVNNLIGSYAPHLYVAHGVTPPAGGVYADHVFQYGDVVFVVTEKKWDHTKTYTVLPSGQVLVDGEPFIPEGDLALQVDGAVWSEYFGDGRKVYNVLLLAGEDSEVYAEFLREGNEIKVTYNGEPPYYTVPLGRFEAAVHDLLDHYSTRSPEGAPSDAEMERFLALV